MYREVMRISKLIPILFLLLTVCSSCLSGTYEDKNGLISFEFKSGNEVYLTTLGNTIATKYRIDGDKVLIGDSDTKHVFTILEDGTLQGPMGMRLIKKE